jgi:hypothetical protein
MRTGVSKMNSDQVRGWPPVAVLYSGMWLDGRGRFCKDGLRVSINTDLMEQVDLVELSFV